jgi:membrane associated rhomboid family serine protease
MPRSSFTDSGPRIQPPSRKLAIVLIGLVAIWLAFAVSINWASSPDDLFRLLAGDTKLVLRGELWRLLTAPVMHDPVGSAGFSHILSTVIGLFFLAPALESEWGTRRLLRFLAVSSIFAYSVQCLLCIVLPAGVVDRLVPPYWFGAMPALEAVAIAFALSMRDRNVLLFFFLPIGSRGLLLATIGISAALVAAGAIGPSGAISPFAGMLAGWMFGGSTPSPVRKLWLRWRLQRLESQATADRSKRRSAARRRFEVLPGGLDKRDKDRYLH